MASKAIGVPYVYVCEFGCGRPATVYGGFPGANDWAGRACDDCANDVHGFSAWESLVEPPTRKEGSCST